MDSDGQTYTPNNIQAQDYRFFDGSATGPDWVIRAYELIVNSYFRAPDDAEYVYDALSDLAYLPIVDQTFEARGSTSLVSIDEQIDVSGGTLSIEDLREAQAKLRYRETRAKFSDRYYDFLKRQGVRVTEQMADMPEMAGHYRKFLWPQKTVDQSTGFTVQSYVHDCHAEFNKPRYLQEHSILLSVACLRPKLVSYGGLAIEREFTSPERVPQVGQLRDHKTIQSLYVGNTDGTPVERTIDDYLWHGQSLSCILDADDPIAGYNPSTLDELRYPKTVWQALVSDKTKLNGNDLAMDGVVTTKIATPLQRPKPVG
jgi:hypothetical protein